MKTRGMGGALVAVITAVVVASAAIWARVYRNRKLALRRGRKKLHLPPPTEDMQPMLNPSKGTITDYFTLPYLTLPYITLPTVLPSDYSCDI